MATADRMLSIFGLFSLDRPQWTVEAAAAELRLPISTTYRYFRSLADAELIAPYTTGRYVLGPAIIQYDRLARHFDPLITAARPAMVALARSAGLPAVVQLSRLFRNRVMCVHQEIGEQPDFAVSFERGQALPLFRGAVSLAILANLPPRTLRAYCIDALADLSGAGFGEDWPTIRARLRALRGEVCITHGKIDAGLIGIAAPILDGEAGVVGSLGLVIAASSVPVGVGTLPSQVEAAAQRAAARFTEAKSAGAPDSSRLTPGDEIGSSV